MTIATRLLLLACCAALAGPVSAGESGAIAPVATATAPMAWVGDYVVHDARGVRRMTIVKDATRIEYRVQDLPVRVWRQVSDGVELQELHPERGERVTFAPGDLRARGREPQWTHIASIVDPALRGQLVAGRDTRAFDDVLQRYRGTDAGKHRIELDWLATAAMPMRYRIDAEAASETIELRAVRSLPSAQAFTPTADLRETDGADLGD
jgi:hypothetical protein